MCHFFCWTGNLILCIFLASFLIALYFAVLKSDSNSVLVSEVSNSTNDIATNNYLDLVNNYKLN